MVSIIAAVADNKAIGKEQGLLWRMPDDMKRFRELTTGHTVIMGRKTFESLPGGALPGRRNIVLTSQREIRPADCTICHSLQQALDLSGREEEVFIIGGETVYRQAMEPAGKIYLTRIRHTFAGADAFFPEIDFSRWEEAEHRDFPADDRHAYPYTFLTYIRKEA
jgi:dihydrofolate reductase